MDPVSVVVGGAPKALDFAMKLAGAWRSHQDATEAELRLLRVLYFEVCQNLEVLARFHIEDRAGMASNDQAYSGVAKLLSVDAHLAVVLVRGETEDELEAVRALRAAAAADREQSLAERERAHARSMSHSSSSSSDSADGATLRPPSLPLSRSPRVAALGRELC